MVKIEGHLLNTHDACTADDLGDISTSFGYLTSIFSETVHDTVKIND